MKQTLALVAFLFAFTSLSAQQKVFHFLYAHYSTGYDFKTSSINKQTAWAGYSIGYNRVQFNAYYGYYSSGTDHQHLNPEDIGNNKLEGELSSSNVIDPDPKPRDSYLEDVYSKYSGPQARLGITCFLRRNDTLGRHPFTGPHAGLEANYMRVTEWQRATYKSDFSEQRWIYDQGRRFHALGAATHIGWQFAFLHDRLYADVRFVIPFLYPFVEEPNVNSPFAGTKYEAQVSLAWHIGWGKSEAETEGTDAPKIREKI